MSRVAILQSNYIPWKGYFDLIASVDKFILYDDMQYTKGDWRNRNKVKTSQGTQWLTIPILTNFGQKINETKVFGTEWAHKHLKSIELIYKKSSRFDSVFPWVRNLYEQTGELKLLSEINFYFIKEICKKIEISTELIDSRQFKIEGIKSEALISVLKQIGGVTSYLSGPAAKSYLDIQLFNQENIKVNWMDYSNYPEYNQMYPPFEHSVSILDLFFNEGENAHRYLKNISLA
ncbi:MAG: WbqC family protein [Ginsengibacter sp.]